MVAAVQESTAPFNEDEKDGILRLLGYPNWASLAQSIQLGFPAASQPLFLVFDSFTRIRPESRARVRTDLCRALDVECQIAESRTRRKTNKVETLELNQNEMADLINLLKFWVTRIADALGVVANPYSQMQYVGYPGGGGFNAPVT